MDPEAQRNIKEERQKETPGNENQTDQTFLDDQNHEPDSELEEQKEQEEHKQQEEQEWESDKKLQNQDGENKQEKSMGESDKWGSQNQEEQKNKQAEDKKQNEEEKQKKQPSKRGTRNRKEYRQKEQVPRRGTRERKEQRQKEQVPRRGTRERKGRREDIGNMMEGTKSQVQIDPRILSCIRKLYYKEVISLISKEKGAIKLNGRRSIEIFCDDEKILEDVNTKLDSFIDEINIISIPRKQVQAGFYMSRKYKEKLQKGGIGFLQVESKSLKGVDYFLGGKVKQEQLSRKYLQIKKTNFTWFYLSNFKNTRSYAKVLNQIFSTQLLLGEIKERFNAQSIEIVYPKESEKEKKVQSIKVILTITGKKVASYPEIEQFLTDFIQNTYFVFCLYLYRGQKQNIYVPKMEDQSVMMFFVDEKTAFSYLFVIVEQKCYKQKLPVIIKEIQELKLNVNGMRYFRGFKPQISNSSIKQDEDTFKFPKYRPYSWTLKSPKIGNTQKRDKFNWKSLLLSY